MTMMGLSSNFEPQPTYMPESIERILTTAHRESLSYLDENPGTDATTAFLTVVDAILLDPQSLDPLPDIDAIQMLAMYRQGVVGGNLDPVGLIPGQPYGTVIGDLRGLVPHFEQADV